jgi:hypothetical protein
MKPAKRRHLFAVAVASAFFAAPFASPAQEVQPGDPAYAQQLIRAVLASPGVLGVELGQTLKGKFVIFAWFENKKALVDWYWSDFHMKGVQWAFPNRAFDRQPLPDTPDDAGQILALVTLKLADAAEPRSGNAPGRRAIQSIGIELYTPLPGGVAVGERFAPKSVRVPALREFTIGGAEGAQ